MDGFRRMENKGKDQKPRIPGIVSLPTGLTRRSSRPASTFGVFSPAPSARAAERGRWARRRKSKSAPGGRVHGDIWPWLCWKGKHPFAPRAFLGFGCRSRCVGLFQPPGVPTRRGASRPAPVAPLDIARVSGWAAHFRFWLGRRAKYRPCPKPNPALKGTRGYALACFPLVWSTRAP